MPDWDTINPLKYIQRASKTITTQSALNPLLWLIGITLLPAVAVTLFGTGYLAWAVCGVFLIPIPATIVAYFMWMFRDPDRLQSEKHQMDLRKITLLGDSVAGQLPTIDQKPIANPIIGKHSDE